jgi:hypothetical protein
MEVPVTPTSIFYKEDLVWDSRPSLVAGLIFIMVDAQNISSLAWAGRAVFFFFVFFFFFFFLYVATIDNCICILHMRKF